MGDMKINPNNIPPNEPSETRENSTPTTADIARSSRQERDLIPEIKTEAEKKAQEEKLKDVLQPSERPKEKEAEPPILEKKVEADRPLLDPPKDTIKEEKPKSELEQPSYTPITGEPAKEREQPRYVPITEEPAKEFEPPKLPADEAREVEKPQLMQPDEQVEKPQLIQPREEMAVELPFVVEEALKELVTEHLFREDPSKSEEVPTEEEFPQIPLPKSMKEKVLSRPTPKQAYTKAFEFALFEKAQKEGLDPDEKMELEASYYFPDPKKPPNLILKEVEKRAAEEVKKEFKLLESWIPAKDPTPFGQKLYSSYAKAFAKTLEKIAPQLTKEEVKQLKFFDPQKKMLYSERVRELYAEICKTAWATVASQHNLPGHLKHNEALAEKIILRDITTNKNVLDAIINGSYVEFLKESLSDFIQTRKPPLKPLEIAQLRKALSKSGTKEQIPAEIKEIASSIESQALSKLRSKLVVPANWSPSPLGSFSNLNPIAGSGLRHMNDSVRIVKDYVNQGLVIGDPGFGPTSSLKAENLLALCEEALPVIEEAIGRGRAPVSADVATSVSKLDDCLKEIHERRTAQNLSPESTQFLNAFEPTLSALKLMLDAIVTNNPSLLMNSMTEFIDNHTKEAIFDLKGIESLLHENYPQLPQEWVNLSKSLITLATLSFASSTPLASAEAAASRVEALVEERVNELGPDIDKQKLVKAIMLLIRLLMLSSVVALAGANPKLRNTVAQGLKDLAEIASGGNERLNQLLSQLLEVEGKTFNPIEVLDTLNAPLFKTILLDIKNAMGDAKASTEADVEKLGTVSRGLLKSLLGPAKWANNVNTSILAPSLVTQMHHTA